MSTSWLTIPRSSHFSLANIPFGIISTSTRPNRRPAIAIGEYVLDLENFSAGGGFSDLASVRNHASVFSANTLNEFAALGRRVHREVRQYLRDVFSQETRYPNRLRDNESLRKQALIPIQQVHLHLPLEIGDYTDFFAGMNHAFKVGTLFRGPENALQPNYKHLPVGYHGRASSVVVSGTPVQRPWGQIILDPKAEPKIPTFAPSKRLDIELELGMFVCKGNPIGQPIPVDLADEYIFGYVLMNDWSARDIQTWEYVPLGPFNAKNFATTISGWVVLPDALEPFAAEGIPNDVEVLPYLRDSKVQNQYDIRLEVDLRSKY